MAFLQGPPLYLSMAGLAADALRERLAFLRKEYNKGKPFPPHKGRVKTGRPVGS